MSFISDLINLTPGQLFMRYWWLWVSILTVLFIVAACKEKFNRDR